MPDELTEAQRAELKATAAELRRVAGFIDGYVRADEDRREVLAAAATELTHIAAGLLGAGGRAVGVTFGVGSAGTTCSPRSA
jgi:hypothetical protein